MSETPQARSVALVIVGMLVLEAVLLLVPMRLAINGHEVDALHAVSAAMRLAAGEAQHLDFVSPLGVLTFQPVAMFMRAGFGPGLAFILSHLLVAVLIAPALWHVAVSRMGAAAGPIFSAVVLIMVTALVYGGDQSTVSVSMYYNRWAWAIYFLVAVIVLLPSRRDTPTLDGLVVGLSLGILALLKATYFITLVPVVAIWVLQTRAWRTGVVVAAVGAVVALAATIAFGGIAFWLAYIADMRFVAASDVRPAPGKGLGDLLAAPAFFAGTACLLGGIIGLRRCGLPQQGLWLLLLAPGFTYITYQNWGNDPKWLILLAFLAAGWRMHVKGDAFGVPGRGYFAGLAVAATVLSVPSVLNMGMSPIRHLASASNGFVPIAANPDFDDLLIEKDRSFDGEAMVKIPVAGAETQDVLTFAGVEMGTCTQKFGYFGKVQEMATALRDMGYGDALLALADVNNPLPLIGGFKTVPGDPPWYYGGTVAADAADYLVIPKCPVSKVTFKAYIGDLNAAGGTWAMVDEHHHFWVFKRAE